MRLTACLMCGTALKQAEEALSLINLLNRDTGIVSRPAT